MPTTVYLVPFMTLGDLAQCAPTLMPWLIQQDLDFCCGGHERLDAAATRLGLNWPDFRQQLEARVKASERTLTPTWQAGGEIALIDHILVAFHASHRADFPPLEAMLAKVCHAHGEKVPLLAELARCVRALIADLEPHMQKEEQVLFPLIRKLCGDASARPACGPASPLLPMQVMRGEHELAGHLLGQLRNLTDNYAQPSWGCATVRALFLALADLDRLLREHIHLENNVLFPMVEVRLAAAEPSWRV